MKKISIELKSILKRTVKGTIGINNYNKLAEKKKVYKNKSIEKKNKKISKAKIEKIKRDFIEQWRQIMFEANICDKFDKTVTPYDIKYISNYGSSCISCKLDFPLGKSINDIKKVLPALSQNIYGNSKKCMAYLDEVETKNGNIVKFSAVKSWHNRPYSLPRKLDPNEIYLGDDINLKPIILNMAKAPHLLITGRSGSGKSKLIEVILTSLALSCTPDELELYFIQSTKDENWRYELLTHTKGCIVSTSFKQEKEKFDQILNLFKYLCDQIDERNGIVKKAVGRRADEMNIQAYNEIVGKKGKKFTVIQVWVDEAANIYKETSDKELKAKINMIRELSEKITTAGRSVGIYIINTLQRASKDELSRATKTSTGNWVSFCQMDESASMLAIGDKDSAQGLPNRVFVTKDGASNIVLGKTPFSAWSNAVSMLEKQGKIKEENEDNFKKDYSHWLNYMNDADEDDGGNVSVNKTSKLVSDELSKANQKISELEFQLQQKDLVITKFRKEIKECLSKSVEEQLKESFEKLEDFENLDYKTAKDQKAKAKDLTSSDYVKAPVVNFSKKSKFVVKE